MNKGVYVTIVCCLVILLIFLPLGESIVTGDEQVFRDNKVILMDHRGQILEMTEEERQTRGIYDMEGLLPETEDGSITGQDPLAKIPSTATYHSGISATAKAMNDEYFKLCHYYAKGTGVPNSDALALYLLAATLVEQGPRGAGGIGDPQLFVTSVNTQQNYESNPNIIKEASSLDHKGSTYWYERDKDGIHVMGPHSQYPVTFNNPTYFPHIPYREDMGTSMKTTARRVTGGVNGNTGNWYDSAQMTAGMVMANWSNMDKNVAALAKSKLSNDYYYITYTAASLHYGWSVMVNPPDTLNSKSDQEKMTARFAHEWSDLMTQDWAITMIRNYVKKEHPPWYTAGDKLETDLLVPLLKEGKRRALEQDSNFFSSSRYTNVMHTNPYMTNDVSNFKSTDWHGINWGNKIASPVKVLISAIILEARYSGEY